MGIVQVGVAVFVHKNGKVLIMRRQGSHGAGTWSVPGGHLEYGETVAECAVREVEEETGLRIKVSHSGAWTETVFQEEGKHYITLYVWAKDLGYDEEPKIMEPNKCSELMWANPSTIPEPLFPPLRNYIEHHGVPAQKGGTRWMDPR